MTTTTKATRLQLVDSTTAMRMKRNQQRTHRIRKKNRNTNCCAHLKNRHSVLVLMLAILHYRNHENAAAAFLQQHSTTQRQSSMTPTRLFHHSNGVWKSSSRSSMNQDKPRYVQPISVVETVWKDADPFSRYFAIHMEHQIHRKTTKSMVQQHRRIASSNILSKHPIHHDSSSSHPVVEITNRQLIPCISMTLVFIATQVVLSSLDVNEFIACSKWASINAYFVVLFLQSVSSKRNNTTK